MKKSIFRGNQYVGSYDNSFKKTKRETFGEKVKSFFTTVSLYALVVIIALGFIELGGYINPTIKVEARDVLVDNLGAKVSTLKEEVITAIQDCERAGFEESDGLITFDPHRTNKRVQPASLGTYQYKVSTVQYYYKALYNKDITPKQAVLIALDDDKARDLTRDIMFTTKNGRDNWITCTNKPAVSQKLAIIKELSK